MARKNRIRKKRTFSALLKTRTVLVVALVAFVLVSVAIGKEVLRRHTINQEVTNLQSEISLLEGRNDELSSLISYLKSSGYQEQEARIKLGLKKPGETVLNIPGQTAQAIDKETEQNGEHQDAQNPQNNPQKWWDFIFARN